MTATDENLHEPATLVVYLLFLFTTSLTISGSWYYEVPVFISFTIITLQLLIYHISNIKWVVCVIANAVKELRKRVTSECIQIAFGLYGAWKLRNLRATRKSLEQELEDDLKNHKKLVMAYAKVKDLESSTKLCSCGSHSDIREASRHLASKRLVCSSSVIGEKYEKLYNLDRQILDLEQETNSAKEGNFSTKSSRKDASRLSTIYMLEWDGACAKIRCKIDEDGKSLAKLLVEKERVERDSLECERRLILARRRYDDLTANLPAESDRLGWEGLWVANYSSVKMVNECNYQALANRQRRRRLSFDIHALELDSWVEKAATEMNKGITTLEDALKTIPHGEDRDVMFELLDKKHARLLEKKTRLVIEQAHALQQYEKSKKLYETEVEESVLAQDHLSEGSNLWPEGYFVITELEDSKDTLEGANRLLHDIDLQIRKSENALQERKTLIQERVDSLMSPDTIDG